MHHSVSMVARKLSFIPHRDVETPVDADASQARDVLRKIVLESQFKFRVLGQL